MDIISTNISELKNEKELKNEIHKQLAGIKVIIYINIIFFTSWLLYYFFGYLPSSFIMYGYYYGNIFLDIPAVLIIFGGISALSIATIVGFYKRYRYSLITARAILVLFCFSLLGLILVLTIFWNRLKLQSVKDYLNYRG